MGIIHYESPGGEMVDAHVLGACGAIHGGSSPLSGTSYKKPVLIDGVFGLRT